MSAIKAKLLGEFNLQTLKIRVTNETYKPNSNISRGVSAFWKTALKDAKAAGRELWNARVYRLLKITKTKNTTTLWLGITDYKTIRASEQILDEIRSVQFQDRPNGLYVSTYISTKDNWYIMGMKSNKSSQRNAINLLGGTLNVDEMKLTRTSDLYKYLIKEILEETGYATTKVDKINGLGIYLTKTMRVAIIFHTRIGKTLNSFKSDVKLNFEHDKLLYVHRSKLNDFVNKNAGSINPNIITTYKLVEA